MEDKNKNPKQSPPTTTPGAPATVDPKLAGLSLGIPAFVIPSTQPRVYSTGKGKFNNGVVALCHIPLLMDGRETGMRFGAHIIQTEAVTPVVRDGKKFVNRAWDIKTATVGRYSDALDGFTVDDEKLAERLKSNLGAIVDAYRTERAKNPAMKFNLAAAAKAAGAVSVEEELTED